MANSNVAGATMKYVPNVAAIDAAGTAAGTAGVAVLLPEMEQAARALAPVDTGAYQASIQTQQEGVTGQLYSDIEYAQYLEFGTSDTPTFATLRRASETAKI